MRKLILAVGLVLGMTSAQAQHFCDTESRTNQSIQENPKAAANFAMLEEFTKSWMEQNPDYERESANTYVIPVVVHIMHDYSSSTNIKKANVLDAIKILNRDFNIENPDTNLIINAFKNRIGGLNIQFKLATLDPDGNCTDGITRTYTELTNNADDKVKDLISWDTDKYYNIWVNRNMASGSGGYAYIPGTAPQPHKEGVMCITTQFGSLPPSGGSNLSIRTLTHETGHYLSLRHTWGPTNSPGVASNCSVDDGVDDTPRCIGASGCNTAANSCVDDTNSFYGFDQVDNIQNYMDYASCERMFTISQANKMDAALNSFAGSRKLLWQPANLVATGVDSNAANVACMMRPDFGASKTLICPGTNVAIYDLSWNGKATSWNWTITGPGTPNLSSTTDSNITGTFPVPGEYTVKLEVTNAAGTVSIEKTAFVGVMNDVPTYSNWHMETFENETTDLPTGFLSSGTGTETFELNTDIGWYTSSKSLYLRNFANQSGDISSVVLPTISVQNTTAPVLSFHYAYAKRTSSSNDKLEIYVSSNCGTTWIKRLTIGTNDLASAPNSALAEFFPQTINDWKVGELVLTGYKNFSNIAIRFDFISGVGNNFFVDNINMRDGVVGVSEYYQPTDLMLMPNPVQDLANLSFGLNADADLDIKVLDLTGQVVKDYGMNSFKEGENNFTLDQVSNLPAGVYLVKLDGSYGSMQKRFVISK